MLEIDRFDEQEKYCPVLGHHLKFGYCRVLGEGLPCSKIRYCWDGRIPISDFLSSHFTRDEQDKIFEIPKNKVSALLTLIDRAQSRSG